MYPRPYFDLLGVCRYADSEWNFPQTDSSYPNYLFSSGGVYHWSGRDVARVAEGTTAQPNWIQNASSF